MKPTKKPDPGKCPICNHPQVAQINQALLSGESRTRIAVKYLLNAAPLSRHAFMHLSLTGAVETNSVRDLKELKERIEKALDMIEAGTADDILRKQHASLMREHRQVTEKLGGISGDINSKTVSALLHRLGVQSEKELLDIVEERRKMSEITVEDLVEDCCKGLLDAFQMNPDFRAPVQARLFPVEPQLEMEA